MEVWPKYSQHKMLAITKSIFGYSYYMCTKIINDLGSLTIKRNHLDKSTSDSNIPLRSTGPVKVTCTVGKLPAIGPL
jgi:hypothetical protein